jgi:hypothetical protein
MTTPGFLFQSEALLLATPTDQLVDTNAALLDKALAFVDDGVINERYVYRRAATTGGLVPTGSPADGRWFSTSGGGGSLEAILTGGESALTLSGLTGDDVSLLGWVDTNLDEYLSIAFNGDTNASNYAANAQFSAGSAPSGQQLADRRALFCNGATQTAGVGFHIVLNRAENGQLHYKIHSTYRSVSGVSSGMFSGVYSGTLTDITSVALTVDGGGTFEAGSRLKTADGRWFRTGPALLLDVALSANVTPADQAPIPFDAGGSLIPSEWDGTAWTASQDYGLCDVTLNLRAAGSNRVVADTRLNGVSINTIDIGATGGSAPAAAISKKVQISSGDVVTTRTFGFALRGDAGLSMSFMQVTRL